MEDRIPHHTLPRLPAAFTRRHYELWHNCYASVPCAHPRRRWRGSLWLGHYRCAAVPPFSARRVKAAPKKARPARLTLPSYAEPRLTRQERCARGSGSPRKGQIGGVGVPALRRAMSLGIVRLCCAPQAGIHPAVRRTTTPHHTPITVPRQDTSFISVQLSCRQGMRVVKS